MGTFDQCSTDELAETVGQLHALMGAAHRQLLEVVAAFDAREGWREDGATSMAAWLAYRRGLGYRTATEWSRVAGALSGLPALGEAFGDGRLSYDQVAPLAKVATAEGDEALAAASPGWSAAQCSALARRARAVTGADAAEAQGGRSLRWHWDLEARMLHVRGRLAEEAGATVVAALEHIADASEPDPDSGTFEPYQARAADALVELASSHLGALASPDRATVVIVADASALAGGEGVVEVDGGPTLGADTLRRHACDARVEVVAQGAEGTPLGVGRARRTVPPWLARQLRRRDGGCRYPSCGRRRWGHAHHLRHWADGGPTDFDNLLWLCPTHHRLVHERGWRIHGDPAGHVTWVRPDGRPLATGPPPLRPDVRSRLLE